MLNLHNPATTIHHITYKAQKEGDQMQTENNKRVKEEKHFTVISYHNVNLP